MAKIKFLEILKSFLQSLCGVRYKCFDLWFCFLSSSIQDPRNIRWRKAGNWKGQNYIKVPPCFNWKFYTTVFKLKGSSGLQKGGGKKIHLWFDMRPADEQASEVSGFNIYRKNTHYKKVILFIQAQKLCTFHKLFFS